jgi:hypothetical protein
MCYNCQSLTKDLHMLATVNNYTPTCKVLTNRPVTNVRSHTAFLAMN